MGPTVEIVSALGGTTMEEGRWDWSHIILRQGTPDQDSPRICTRMADCGGLPCGTVLWSCCVSTEYQRFFSHYDMPW